VVLFYCHCWLASVVHVCAPFKSSARRSNPVRAVQVEWAVFKSSARCSNPVRAVQVEDNPPESNFSMLYLPWTDVYKGGGWKVVNCTHNPTHQHLYSVEICLAKTTRCPGLLKLLSKWSGGTSNQHKHGQTVT
jgi:hypothetical protein